jgi:hypothetical protein
MVSFKMCNSARDFLPTSYPKSKNCVEKSYTNIKQMVEVEQMFSDFKVEKLISEHFISQRR